MSGLVSFLSLILFLFPHPFYSSPLFFFPFFSFRRSLLAVSPYPLADGLYCAASRGLSKTAALIPAPVKCLAESRVNPLIPCPSPFSD